MSDELFLKVGKKNSKIEFDEKDKVYWWNQRKQYYVHYVPELGLKEEDISPEFIRKHNILGIMLIE